MRRRTVLRLPLLLAVPGSAARLVAFGDSITAGMGGARPFAPQVAARLGYVLDNRAVGSTFAAQHAAAIQATTFGACDRALWLTGFNDMRGGTDLETYRALLTAGFAACPVALLLGNCLRMATYDYQGSDARVEAMNGIIAEVAAGFPLVTLVDTCAAYDPHNTNDAVHPNDAGHRQIATAFAPWRLFSPIWGG